jgi:hypothetical protein
MAIMVAARSVHDFEFFAQPHQKNLRPCNAGDMRLSAADNKRIAHKKARPDFSGAGCKVQGNLEVLEKLTVVGSFAV